MLLKEHLVHYTKIDSIDFVDDKTILVGENNE